MSTLWIVQVVPGEWGTEFLEHRNKLAACQCITHVRLKSQRDANPRGDVELTSAELREIDEAASRISVKGERLPEAVLKFTNG